MHAAADVAQQGLAERVAGVDRHIVGAQFAAGRLDPAHELADTLEVTGPDRLGVDAQGGRYLFQIAELLVAGKREGEFLGGQQMEDCLLYTSPSPRD